MAVLVPVPVRVVVGVDVGVLEGVPEATGTVGDGEVVLRDVADCDVLLEMDADALLLLV